MDHVSVPLPTADEVNLQPPGRAEVELLSRAYASAVAPAGGLTPLQRVLGRAIAKQMTGHDVDPAGLPPLGPDGLAEGLRQRNLEFRTHITHLLLLGELILAPLPPEVSERVESYAAALGVDDGMITVSRDYASGSLGLAAFDFDRSGYTAEWSEEQASFLHTSQPLAGAWDFDVKDAALAARWSSLEALAPNTLGRKVFDFYQARGFAVPGLPGSAPPYLAQHDWVHVLGDYGTTVEAEIEVFGLIARAIPDPRGFSLLAMVISLFETGYMATGAGLFRSDLHHLSRAGVADRLADAMRRGALCGKDLMAIDYFRYASLDLDHVRKELGIGPKSADALEAGSVGPWEPGGISPFQLAAGRAMAEQDGRDYDPLGATPPAT
jgi:hypothetical protein